ncbi:MAG: ROK family protein [Clostridia bacterium]|nr:ROK family protein [Clostridia bacterium]
MYAIGVDIGGMRIKVGLVDENGKIIASTRKPTAKTADICIKETAEQIKELLKTNGLKVKDIKGVGIGSPGSVSGKTGIVEYASNLGWNRVDLFEGLKKQGIDTKMRLSNDANVAALAESVYGAAKGYNSSVMFTLGTGVGGGIIIDHKLFEGEDTKGTEVGHTTLIYGGEKCPCGRSGCIEAYVSATALIRQTKQKMLEHKDSKMWEFCGGDIEKASGRTAFECAKQGDKYAIEVRNKYVEYLAESMMNFMNIFRPNVFILGGGISGQGQHLVDLLDDYCNKRYYGFNGTPRVKILCATLGNDAGIIGAAALLDQN